MPAPSVGTFFKKSGQKCLPSISKFYVKSGPKVPSGFLKAEFYYSQTYGTGTLLKVPTAPHEASQRYLEWRAATILQLARGLKS